MFGPDSQGRAKGQSLVHIVRIIRHLIIVLLSRDPWEEVTGQKDSQ